MKIVASLLFCFLGFAPTLLAKTCTLEIEGNDQMQFSKKELTVGADCTEVELKLKHVGKLPKNAMGHNWVLSLAKDRPSIVAEGMKAGLGSDFLPKGNPNIIANTKLIGGGEETSVTFPVSKLKKGEAYAFFCTFPGHDAMMNGKLIY